MTMKKGVRTPQTSIISPERWQPFVVDDDLGCYSYYLPHSSTDAVISSSRLDEWFTALHPNNYINEPDRTCMGQMPPVRIEYYHEIYGMVCQSQQ